MDEKGRVSLPAAFRKGGEGERFLLVQWEEPYLTLFPAEAWRRVQERLLEYRKSDPAAWAHVREVASNATEVSPDKQGRILIPANLQAKANLKGTVVLNGNLDRVEIWNPDDFRRSLEARAPGFERFARQIFG